MFLTRKPSSPAGFWTTKVLVAAILSIAATTAEAQDAPAPAAQPAQGAAAPAQPSAGVAQPEWEKVCGNVKEQQECHISRRRVAATGQALMQFMIIERGDKKLIQVAVPPVALIQPGVQVKIDENQPTGVKFVVCTPGECLALGEINTDFVAGLKKGNDLIVTMLNPQGKPVAFDISLSGFTASYDGPGLNPAEAQARQQKLEDELKRKADTARQQLLNAQQQTSTTQ
ncbi:MAG: invasion associated locus B family protein [Pseudomonadota bacterium]|nr:invasion associated locus B family protein [Pseudomonadota bacterium]